MIASVRGRATVCAVTTMGVTEQVVERLGVRSQ
jgi:hypothetical protein